MFGNTTSLKLEVKDLLTFTSCVEKFCTSWPAMSSHYYRLPLLSYSSLYLSSLSSVTSHRWGKQSPIQLSYIRLFSWYTWFPKDENYFFFIRSLNRTEAIKLSETAHNYYIIVPLSNLNVFFFANHCQVICTM